MRRTVIAGCLLLAMLVWIGGAESVRGAADTELPTAPAFELVTSAGEAVSQETLKGRPSLLVFWAPWCRVCQQDLPEIARFYREAKPEALRVISIGFADLRSNVEAFVRARPGVFIFPTAYDEERWVAQAFRINATPTYVALNAEGRIALLHRGGGVLQSPRFRGFLASVER